MYKTVKCTRDLAIFHFIVAFCSSIYSMLCGLFYDLMECTPKIEVFNFLWYVFKLCKLIMSHILVLIIYLLHIVLHFYSYVNQYIT